MKLKIVGFALVATFLVACGSSKDAPKGNGGRDTAKPAAPATPYGNVCNAAGLDALVVTIEGSAICTGLAGFGTCLAESDWFEEGGAIYDVWYCEADGDTITFCPCGDDLDCQDTGLAIQCVEG